MDENGPRHRGARRADRALRARRRSRGGVLRGRLRARRRLPLAAGRRRPAPHQLPARGGHRAPLPTARHSNEGDTCKQSSSRRLERSSSVRSSRSASSASGSTRPGARRSRRSCRPATCRSSRSTSPQQVAGGADMLDVNVGDPLADEVALMGQAVPLVQGLCDLPLCIDSSVIEALEAGLAAYEGKALVNSVTGEDERLEAILPIVARHGAAVIGLANDERDPDGAGAPRRGGEEDRLRGRRPRHPARGRRHRPARDAGRRGAARGHALPRDAAPPARRARREHHLRRVEHVVRAARDGTRSAPRSSPSRRATG